MLHKLKEHLGGKDSLRRSMLRAGHYALMKSVCLGVFEFIRTAVFSRILTAQDYGLMALTTTGIGLLEAFSYTGIDLIILRDDAQYQRRLAAYFGVNFIRGVVLFVLAWFAATPVANYYHQPQIIWLMRVSAIVFLLKGISGFGTEICQRDLHFDRIAKTEIGMGLPLLICSLLGLLILRNVWALVAYQICAAAAFMARSYILYPWRPKICLTDKKVWQAVFSFGGSIVVLNILNYFFNNFDRSVIGKLFDVESVGYYARSHFLALLPVTHLANVIAPVFMPTFRQIADDLPRLRRAFLRTLCIYAAFFISLQILLYFGAPWIVKIVYGERWLSIIPVYRILLIYSAVKGISTICPSIFFLQNKPWFVTLCAGVMAGGLFILGIPLSSHYGTIGTAWAVVISASASNILAIMLTLRELSTKV